MGPELEFVEMEAATCEELGLGAHLRPDTLWKGMSSPARLLGQPPCPNTGSVVGGQSPKACKESGGGWGSRGSCAGESGAPRAGVTSMACIPGIDTRGSDRCLRRLCHMADK